MPNYLIAISIGPVQDFIASARRTRDLWFGSELLSTISRSVAMQLYKLEAELVFPASDNPATDLGPDSTFNVGNKLLASITTDDPTALASSLKNIANTRWRELAEHSLAQYEVTLSKCLDRSLWNSQLDDVLEFYCAWVPYSDDDYDKARRRVDALLSARKNSRDFFPAPANTPMGLAKSSLDGLRESVIKSARPWQRRQLGLGDSEQLDSVGLVKRLGGKVDQFTPISRVALDPWLNRVLEQNPHRLDKTLSMMASLCELGIVSRVNGNQAIYKAFPYDGQLLYPFRIQAEIKRFKQEKDEQSKSAIKLLEQLETTLSNLSIYKQYGEPSPYFAMILADGDRIGELLGDLPTEQQQRAVSLQLTQFANGVPNIVRNHRGHAIYAGGDDVLALVPLNHVLACAQALHDDFGKKLADLQPDPNKLSPTLSVGVAIGHVLEPMAKQLALAWQAEALAKGNDLKDKVRRKDGLGIILKPRSGSAIGIRSRWADDNPVEYLTRWRDAHVNEEFPDRAAYQLRQLALDLTWVKSTDNDVIKYEVTRLLKRKRAGQGNKELSDALIESLVHRVTQVGLEGVANELILTRRLAEAIKSNTETQAVEETADA